MQVKLSNKFWAVQRRIKNLPVITEKSIKGNLKRDAEGFVNEFETGIAANKLGLKRLKEPTVRRKRRQGFSRPRTPLFGDGQYSRMMKIFELKHGWSVRPKSGTHSSGLKFKDILDVHEYGRTIITKHAVIIIPARPARSRAYQKYLRKRKKVDTHSLIRKQINEYIRNAKVPA